LQVVRSNDIDRGLPHNLIQFTVLQELMAGWLGLEVGKYVHVMDSVHFYPELSDRMAVDDQVIPARNTDRFEEPYETSIRAFAALAARMDRIIDARQSGTSPRYGGDQWLPRAYENMFAIIAADDARRHGNREIAEALVEQCDNPALRQLWTRWVERVDSKHPAAACAV
jgi:thymidylate synthase